MLSGFMFWGLPLHLRTRKSFNGNAMRPSRRLVVKLRSVCALHSKRGNNANVRLGKRPNVKRESGLKEKGRTTLLRGVA
jgi:hypothetical protein